MSNELPFDLDFSPEPEAAAELSALTRRVVAANPGPFTFKGTCTYIVGRGEVAVIDPGPDLPAHVEAVLAALAGESVKAILVTHTHRDHSPSARALQNATGAPILGCGPHRRSRPLAKGEPDTMEGSGDLDYRPDRELTEGDVVEGPGWTLEALASPGHTANHLCFRLAEENALFSGDHVMGWSTTIVAPPDGSMTSFMASLDKLRGRSETVYWPGHGGPVNDPQRLVRALIHHRRQREASILSRLEAGDRTAASIVDAIYKGLAPALVRAARLSVFAHLEDLVGQGRARTEGSPQLSGEYWPA
jgi:glyoxylase-like metal-dependent hydrolase (beta-lactamase superfamily II)